jgi:DNA-binding CsgD family transcriptional regulator
LSGEPALGAPLRVAIGVSGRHLADRLAAALKQANGIEVVRNPAEAHAIIVDGGFKPPLAGPEVSLTERERTVLALLVEGASNKEIARALNISAHTAKFHVRSLLDKLDAVSRTGAVVHAARLGVISL